MKRFLLIFAVLFLSGSFNFSCAFENISVEDEVQTVKENKVQENKVLQAEVSFDWLDISQAQRDDQIAKYKDLLFGAADNPIYYSKDEFKKNFSSFSKDKDFKHHYMLTNNGVTQDEEAKYCACGCYVNFW